MSKIINVGLIGFGMSGKYFQAPFIHNNPNFNLYKVLERHSEESGKLYPGVKVVKDLAAILSDDKVELVVISSPNNLHYEMAVQSLKAGKHVIVEKPFTVNSKEALKLKEIAEKNKLVLAPYHNRRWDGDFLTVKNLIGSGVLGELVEYESHFDRYRNYIKPNAWREKNELGSGLLYDLCPHLMDQTLALFGMPQSVYADLRIQRKDSAIYDYFDLSLEYGRLKVILKASMLVKGKTLRFRICGTNGTYSKYGLDPQENALKQGVELSNPDWGNEDSENWGVLDAMVKGVNFNGKIETLPGAYQKFYENIYDAICYEKKLVVTPDDAINTIKIIETATESYSKKRTINL